MKLTDTCLSVPLVVCAGLVVVACGAPPVVARSGPASASASSPRSPFSACPAVEAQVQAARRSTSHREVALAAAGVAAKRCGAVDVARPLLSDARDGYVAATHSQPTLQLRVERPELTRYSKGRRLRVERTDRLPSEESTSRVIAVGTDGTERELGRYASARLLSDSSWAYKQGKQQLCVANIAGRSTNGLRDWPSATPAGDRVVWVTAAGKLVVANSTTLEEEPWDLPNDAEVLQVENTQLLAIFGNQPTLVDLRNGAHRQLPADVRFMDPTVGLALGMNHPGDTDEFDCTFYALGTGRKLFSQRQRSLPELFALANGEIVVHEVDSSLPAVVLDPRSGKHRKVAFSGPTTSLTESVRGVSPDGWLCLDSKKVGNWVGVGSPPPLAPDRVRACYKSGEDTVGVVELPKPHPSEGWTRLLDIGSLVLSPSGKAFAAVDFKEKAYGKEAARLVLYAVQDGRPLRTFPLSLPPASADAVAALEFSPDEAWVTVTVEGRAQRVETATGRVVDAFVRPKVAIKKDREFILGNMRGSVAAFGSWAWDLATGKPAALPNRGGSWAVKMEGTGTPWAALPEPVRAKGAETGSVNGRSRQAHAFFVPLDATRAVAVFPDGKAELFGFDEPGTSGLSCWFGDVLAPLEVCLDACLVKGRWVKEFQAAVAAPGRP